MGHSRVSASAPAPTCSDERGASFFSSISLFTSVSVQLPPLLAFVDDDENRLLPKEEVEEGLLDEEPMIAVPRLLLFSIVGRPTGKKNPGTGEQKNLPCLTLNRGVPLSYIAVPIGWKGSVLL